MRLYVNVKIWKTLYWKDVFIYLFIYEEYSNMLCFVYFKALSVRCYYVMMSHPKIVFKWNIMKKNAKSYKRALQLEKKYFHFFIWKYFLNNT